MKGNNWTTIRASISLADRMQGDTFYVHSGKRLIFDLWYFYPGIFNIDIRSLIISYTLNDRGLLRFMYF